jgi:hypothetical protein
MELAFSSPKLERLCCNQAELVELWGHPVALLLCQRLLEIDAAGSLAELCTLPHILFRTEEFPDRHTLRGSILVTADVRIAVTVRNTSDRSRSRGEPDLINFTAMTIQTVECG